MLSELMVVPEAWVTLVSRVPDSLVVLGILCLTTNWATFIFLTRRWLGVVGGISALFGVMFDTGRLLLHLNLRRWR